MPRRRCQCPADGSRYCPTCQALLRRAGEPGTPRAAALFLPAAHPDSPPAWATPPPTTPLDRYTSATERRYAALLAQWERQGIIQQWWYEPCKGLYLAPRTSYTPDFLVWRVQEGFLEFHEVKGAFIRAKDWEKVKFAAVTFPIFRFVLAQWKDGAWHWREVPYC